MEEDKRALEKEKARIPNQSDIDEKMKNLHKDCEELRRQIAQKNSEITDHTILLTDKRKKFGVTTRQHEELTHTLDGLEVGFVPKGKRPNRLLCCFQTEYMQVTLRPAELLKQTDNLGLQRE